MKKILSFKFKSNKSKPCFNEARLQRSKASKIEKGFTIIELLVIMIIIAILATLGSKAFTGMQSTARLQATIDEMRNMVNVLATIEEKLGGKVGGKWDITPSFPDNGIIKQLNASMTFTSLPEENPFSDSAEILEYTYSISPTVKLSTIVPLDDVSPNGFLSADADSVSLSTGTKLTVYPRYNPNKKVNKRSQWVKKFYYEQTYRELKQKQASGTFLANYLLGKYAADK
jgi:prepilin-type N-terminal cleavage/methylation domain-containing protein